MFCGQPGDQLPAVRRNSVFGGSDPVTAASPIQICEGIHLQIYINIKIQICERINLQIYKIAPISFTPVCFILFRKDFPWPVNLFQNIVCLAEWDNSVQYLIVKN